MIITTVAAWWCREDLRAWYVGYRFTWLPDGVIPASVNARGDAAVNRQLPEDRCEPGLWSPADRGFVPLGTLPDGDVRTSAYAINGRGSIIGSVGRGGDHLARAFFWSKEVGMREIQKLGGQQIAPLSLNNRDQVVGWAHPPAPGSPWRAFLWSPDGGVQDLGALLGGGESQAQAINEAGWVVGNATASSGSSLPFLWKPESGMRTLPLVSGFTSGCAVDVNDRGEVLVSLSKVGASGTMPFAVHYFASPYLWTEGGGFAPLPVPEGYDSVEGQAINNRGQVLLRARKVPGGGMSGYVVSHGALKKLPDAIEGGLTYYNDLNDLGWLVGGVGPSGNAGKPVTRGFLAKPVW